MHDVRGTDKHLHEISTTLARTKFRQSGPVDSKILCDLHERQTQAADDYAIEFCRRVVSHIPQGTGRQTIPNPKPNLLAKFVYQTIWKFSASHVGRGLGALGSYAAPIEESIFGAGKFDFPFFVSRNHLQMPDQTESTLVIAPFPTRFGQWRCWIFSVGGVQFYLKLDRRNFPSDWNLLLANYANPVTLFQLDAVPATAVPFLKAFFDK